MAAVAARWCSGPMPSTSTITSTSSTSKRNSSWGRARGPWRGGITHSSGTGTLGPGGSQVHIQWTPAGVSRGARRMERRGTPGSVAPPDPNHRAGVAVGVCKIQAPWNGTHVGVVNPAGRPCSYAVLTYDGSDGGGLLGRRGVCGATGTGTAKAAAGAVAGGEAQRRGTLFFLTILLTRKRIKKKGRKGQLMQAEGSGLQNWNKSDRYLKRARALCLRPGGKARRPKRRA